MSEDRVRYVVVGQWMTDVVAELPGPLREGTDTNASVQVLGGGAAANTAAWLAHDGEDTTFVARIGDDLLGRAGRAEASRPSGCAAASRSTRDVRRGRASCWSCPTASAR